MERNTKRRWLILILAVLLAGNGLTGDSTIATTQAFVSDADITNLRVHGDLSIGGHLGRNNIWTRWNINDLIPQNADTFFTLTARNLTTTTGDSSRHVHPGIAYFPEGFPRNSDTVSAWKFWLVTTPLIHGEFEENPTIHVSNDITNPQGWSNSYHPGVGHTFNNPTDTISSSTFIEDTIYYYHNGSNKAYYDTNGTGVDSHKVNQRASYLSDPGLLQTADGKLCLFYRATWNVANLPMSAIFSRVSNDGVNWGAAHRITRFGRWKSPAIVLDTGSLYIMFVSTDKDSVSGRKNADTLYRLTSKTLDTFFTYAGTCSGVTVSGNGHQSAWAPAYDQMFLVTNGTNIRESRDHGLTWTSGDSVLIKDGPSGEWDDILYQISIFGIDEGSHMTLGCVFSSFYDSSGTKIWHTGYKEVPFLAPAATPAPSSWTGAFSACNILGNKRTDDSIRCIFPYSSGNEWVLFLDTSLSSFGIDSVTATYAFDAKFRLDSLKFWRKSLHTVVDSLAILICKPGSIFADSIHSRSWGDDMGAGGSWTARNTALDGIIVTAGQEITVKWFFEHTAAHDWIQIKKVVIYGKRYYD